MYYIPNYMLNNLMLLVKIHIIFDFMNVFKNICTGRDGQENTIKVQSTVL